MNMGIISVIALVATLFATPISAFKFQAVKAQAIIVPNDFPSIQQAIDAAEPGSTVYVRAGTYVENLIVNKSITLKGEEKESTIVSGNGNTVIQLEADNITVENLTIRDGGFSYNTNSGVISIGHSNNSILNDIFLDNLVSIYLNQSNSNIIAENTITGATQWYYIELENSNDNIVRDNSMINNTGYGILLLSSHSNLVDNNSVTGVENSANFEVGIDAESSFNDTIQNNIVKYNRYSGIMLRSTRDLVLDNLVSSNNFGIYSSDSNTTISQNIIFNNTLGALDNSQDVIFNNSFIQNQQQIQTNLADGKIVDAGYASRGNFWDDYTGTDYFSGPLQNEPGSDGIGDTPYGVAGGCLDRYPLFLPSVPSGEISAQAPLYEFYEILLSKCDVLLTHYNELTFNLTRQIENETSAKSQLEAELTTTKQIAYALLIATVGLSVAVAILVVRNRKHAVSRDPLPRV